MYRESMEEQAPSKETDLHLLSSSAVGWVQSYFAESRPSTVSVISDFATTVKEDLGYDEDGTVRFEKRIPF